MFAIGLAAYWPQFEGLRERLEGYRQELEARLAELGADIVSAGLVDTPEAARTAGESLAAARVELILLYTATYATSSQVLPAVQAAKAPVVVLNLQPTRSLDYEGMTTGEWLANCSACCVPELAGAFTRARVPYSTVTGTLQDGDPAWETIGEWVDAARAVQGLRSARLGFLGHTYPGMLDLYSDFTQIHAQTGAHVEVLEIDELVARVDSADPAAIGRKGDEIRAVFDLADPGTDPIAVELSPEVFEWSARVAVGLDRLVEDFALDGLTYYYRGVDGNVNERVGAGLIVGNSLLTGRGVPTAGEGDLKTNVAMFLMDRLGAGGSYTEFYALDFEEEFVLMGHDGPCSPRNRRRQAGGARARPLPRQVGSRPFGGDEGAAGARDDPGPDPDGRRPPEAARSGGGVDPWSDVPDREHQLARPVRSRPGGIHGRLVRGRPDSPRRARRRSPALADPEGRGTARARARDRRLEQPHRGILCPWMQGKSTSSAAGDRTSPRTARTPNSSLQAGRSCS